MEPSDGIDVPARRGSGGAVGRPAVVGLVGRSGSGKTTLLELLIPALKERGLAVGAVKHTSHGFLADRPGKDSYRLYESGAEAVALVSSEQLATFVRRPTGLLRDEEPSLAAGLASLPEGLDLVLAEGFSWEPIPRLVVVPGSEEPLAKHTGAGETLGIVRVPEARDGARPAIPADLVDALARDLADLARADGFIRADDFTHEGRRIRECKPTTSPPVRSTHSWTRTGPSGEAVRPRR